MHFTSTQITDALIAIQAFITLLIAIRAFSFYFRTHSDVLLILGLSMGIIAIGGITNAIDDYFLGANPIYNTLWFRHIGQTVAFLFIFLASLGGSERYTKGLVVWDLVATGLLLILMFLTPILPEQQQPQVIGVLSAIRSVSCLATACSYTTIFFRKGTRFSLMMLSAFFLMGIGLWIYAMEYFLHRPILFDYISSVIRLIGLIVLYIAFFV
jgi:hypothetical protein